MLGLFGIAILVGLGAGGVALYSGFSILMALGAYMLFGWLFVLTAILVICTIRSIKVRVLKQDHAYSG